MKYITLASFAVLALTACEKEPTPAATPVAAPTTETAVPTLSATDKAELDRATTIPALFELYVAATGIKKTEASARLVEMLKTTSDKEAVDKLYRSFSTPSIVRITLIDAQRRLNPTRIKH